MRTAYWDSADPEMYFDTVQPVISATVSGSEVAIKWDWGGNSPFLDSCEIQVDRGDGKGFVLLTFDTTPGFIDPTVLPTVLAKWSYRAIYRVADERVGQWSGTVSIAMGG